MGRKGAGLGEGAGYMLFECPPHALACMRCICVVLWVGGWRWVQ